MGPCALTSHTLNQLLLPFVRMVGDFEHSSHVAADCNKNNVKGGTLIRHTSLLLLQLDEDVRVLVQRFDAETADEDENKSKQFDVLICIKTSDLVSSA